MSLSGPRFLSPLSCKYPSLFYATHANHMRTSVVETACTALSFCALHAYTIKVMENPLNILKLDWYVDFIREYVFLAWVTLQDNLCKRYQLFFWIVLNFKVPQGHPNSHCTPHSWLWFWLCWQEPSYLHQNVVQILVTRWNFLCGRARNDRAEWFLPVTILVECGPVSITLLCDSWWVLMLPYTDTRSKLLTTLAVRNHKHSQVTL